jgi:hypothetical protein
VGRSALEVGNASSAAGCSEKMGTRDAAVCRAGEGAFNGGEDVVPRRRQTRCDGTRKRLWFRSGDRALRRSISRFFV